MSNAPRRPVATKVTVPPENTAKEARSSTAVRNYMLFCFAALFCMVPVLLLKGMDLWCIFPLILGSLSLMANWNAGPVFVLISLAVLFPLRARGLDPITCVQLFFDFSAPPVGLLYMPATPFLDFLLSVCVLAYLAGHYRLQALVHHVIPPEARKSAGPRADKKRVPVPSLNPRRVPTLLNSWELPLLGAATLVSALAGEYLWIYFRGLQAPLRMYPGNWRTIVFVWCSALVLLSAWAVFGYLARRRATREESILYLQDQLWRQTRREQTRISRWIAWARLRYLRREEKTS